MQGKARAIPRQCLFGAGGFPLNWASGNVAPVSATLDRKGEALRCVRCGELLPGQQCYAAGGRATLSIQRPYQTLCVL